MKQLTRHENWPSLLKEFTREWYGQDLVWGKYDCCMIVISWIEKCTNVSVCDKYTTKRGAYDMINKISNGGIVGAFEKLTSEYNMPQAHPQKTQRGDIVLAKGVKGAAGGICVGRYILSFDLARNKCTYFPLESTIMSWRV